MRTSDFSRYILGICATAAMLAGCGGSQPPIGAPSAMSQSHAIATHDRGGSWMLPEAKAGDLLYVSNNALGTVNAYTYPEGHLVGSLTGFITPFGECTDAAGDVFIVAYSDSSKKASTIYEYAHGGTAPIATLSDPTVAFGCAIDPATGNLAASGGGVAIFTHATGTPMMYYSSQFTFFYCGYDNRGNLYLSAWNDQQENQALLVRLATASHSFEQITLDATLYMDVGFEFWPSVQWDGKHMAVSSGPERRPASIYRLRISGSTATVAGTTNLSTQKDVYTGQFVLQGRTVVGLGNYKRGATVFLWRYPRGGSPYRKASKAGHRYELRGAAISVASSR